jgi:hypothetical protein
MPPTHEQIIRAFTTPGHPAAFSTPGRVAEHFNIGLAAAKRALEHVEGYTLHREYKRPRVYNPYYVRGRRKQVQADLIDVSKMRAANDGVTFLLVLIDIFTKRLWVYPLKRKLGELVDGALADWLGSIDRPPKVLMTDRGLEFTNGAVQQRLAAHGVEWQPANGTLKACIAERVNKTLQILIYKYLTENETMAYLDALPGLVRTYNNRGHRTLQGMTPAEADRPESEHLVQAIFHQRYAKVARHRKSKLPFRVGDLVRLKTQAKQKTSSSARAYAEQFHEEFYRIVRINRTLPIALYYLKSLVTGDVLEGGAYANELQRQRGDVFKIDTVQRRRTRNGRRELFVRWKGFGPQYDEWIPEAAVVRVF